MVGGTHLSLDDGRSVNPRSCQMRALTVDTAPAATQCSDGIDNDADGRIDLDDKQCKSAEQQSESDPRL